MSGASADADASTGPAAASPGRTSDLDAAVHALARTPRLLLALDFDGTLAPFVDRPGGARMLPASKRALDRLEHLSDTWVAYVSGRPLAGLEDVTEADPDALLIGSHGVEVRFGRAGVDLGLTDAERHTLERLHKALEAITSRDPRLFLEVKPVGFGVHTRRVEPDEARRVNTEARAAALSISDALTERDGKDILEFSVRSANKGDGVDRLRAHTRATAVLFAGDDVTDEDGFRVLRPTDGDVGIKVGSGPTLAEFRLPDTEAIASMLGTLVQLRAAR